MGSGRGHGFQIGFQVVGSWWAWAVGLISSEAHTTPFTDFGFVVFCVLLKKKKLKNKLNQRKGRWVCGHSVCSVADDGSTMGTCW